MTKKKKNDETGKRPILVVAASRPKVLVIAEEVKAMKEYLAQAFPELEGKDLQLRSRSWCLGTAPLPSGTTHVVTDTHGHDKLLNPFIEKLPSGITVEENQSDQKIVAYLANLFNLEPQLVRKRINLNTLTSEKRREVPPLPPPPPNDEGERSKGLVRYKQARRLALLEFDPQCGDLEVEAERIMELGQTQLAPDQLHRLTRCFVLDIIDTLTRYGTYPNNYRSWRLLVPKSSLVAA